MTPRVQTDRQPAAELPVARVCVDVPLPHLDRPFDYLVPSTDDETARPGVRVKVRFAGQLVDGWLLERVARSDHDGRLAYLERVVSPEPVLTAEMARLARAVADRYAGSLADVLRLAVPPRHAPGRAAGAGRRGPVAVDPRRAAPDRGRVATPTRPGAAFLRALRRRHAPRGRSGRRCRARTGRPGSPRRPRPRCRPAGAVVAVVPDARDLDRLDAALPRRSARAGTSALQRGARAGRAVPARSSPPAGATCGWWPAPGRRCSRRCATSGWWRSGTTATTCTPSRGRPTRTLARCC